MTKTEFLDHQNQIETGNLKLTIVTMRLILSFKRITYLLAYN